MQEKKVLILTLGKGTAKSSEDNKDISTQLPVDDIIQKLKSGEYSYRPAKYQYEDQPIIESAFVATVLFEKYMPDKIAIVGTGSSMWTELYHKMCLLSDENELTDDQLKNMSKIMNYERDYNKDIKNELLEEEEKLLNTVFRELADHLKIQIQIILTKYGVNEEELVYNYEKFKLLRNLFEEGNDMVYKVAFDITHSFRSLPIFNLAILKYLQSFIDSKVIIEKVFYGNLEIRGEYNNIAPIVDLSMLTKTIDLANGIVEFNNTGNAVTICRNILEIDPNSVFIKYVQGFDWATQTNNRDEVFENLQKILEYDFSETEKQRPLIFDAEYAIQTALKMMFGDMFFSDVYIQQLLLAKWSFRQGRVGLAAAIGKEALRSFLVRKYAELEGVSIDFENEDDRQRAEQKFRNRCSQVGESHVFNRFIKIEPDVTKIRNIFAHNLQGGGQIENYDYTQAKNYIEEFLEVLSEIVGKKPVEFQYTNKYKGATAKNNYLIITDKHGSAAKNFARKSISANSNPKDVDLWVVENISLDVTVDPSTKNKSNKKRGKREKIAKILCGKIAEHFAMGRLTKIVWDANLDDALILNASTLIKNMVDPSICFRKMKQNGSIDEILIPYWRFDTEALLADVSTKFFKEYSQVAFRKV